MKYSPIRRMARYALRTDIISFAAGAPNVDTFPNDDIRDIAASILASDFKGALQYGLTLGFAGLVDAVVDLCQRQKGIESGSANVAITSGSQQALDLLGRLFLNPGDVVFVELPSYIGGISAFRNLQAELVGVRQMGDGIDIEDLVIQIQECRQAGKTAKFIYVIPNFQNPTGITLSLEKRRALIEVAERFGLLIVEDDPYGEVYFNSVSANQIRPIKSLDHNGRVVYVSSFSKILSAGLRTAWVIAAAPIIEKLDLAKQASDLCGSMLDQRIVAECWNRGIVQRHLPRIREFYGARCRVMLECLQACMPLEVRWTEPSGGLFLWLTLPGAADTERLLDEAIEDKVTYVSGASFFVNGKGQNTLRLAFSRETPDNIAVGIERLAQLFKRHL